MIRGIIREDVDRVNVLRESVLKLHVENEPDIFKSEFQGVLSDYIYEFLDAEEKWAYVYIEDDNIVGYVMAELIIKPETSFRYETKYIEICEIGVDEAYQGRGIGTALIDTIKKLTIDKGVKELQLNVWGFNDKAIGCYKKCGFEEYRTHLRIKGLR